MSVFAKLFGKKTTVFSAGGLEEIDLDPPPSIAFDPNIVR